MQNLDIQSAVTEWCDRRFNFRASFYTGRGVNLGDLNSTYLEMIYQGLKTDVGQEAATNFVNFVDNLKDLSASGFIQAFERFWWSGCTDTYISLPAGVGNQLTGRGDALIGEGFALIAAGMGGGLPSPEVIEAQSRHVKAEFLKLHKSERTRNDYI